MLCLVGMAICYTASRSRSYDPRQAVYRLNYRLTRVLSLHMAGRLATFWPTTTSALDTSTCSNARYFVTADLTHNNVFFFFHFWQPSIPSLCLISINVISRRWSAEISLAWACWWQPPRSRGVGPLHKLIKFSGVSSPPDPFGLIWWTSYVTLVADMPQFTQYSRRASFIANGFTTLLYFSFCIFRSRLLFGFFFGFGIGVQSDMIIPSDV